MARRKEYRESEGRSEGRYGDFNKSKVAQTDVEDWALMKDSPMRQEGNGSMDYRSKKDSIDKEDARKIGSAILPQK